MIHRKITTQEIPVYAASGAYIRGSVRIRERWVRIRSGCVYTPGIKKCAKVLPGSGIEPEAFGYPSNAVTSPRDEGKDLWIQRSYQLSYPGIVDSSDHQLPQYIQLFFWRISGNTTRPDTNLTRQLSRTPPKTSTFVHSKKRQDPNSPPNVFLPPRF